MALNITDQELGKTIAQLCQVAADTHLGYQTAAEKVENAELKDLYNDYANQRSSFVSQLMALAPVLADATPTDEPSAGGKLQAGWIGFREAINWESEKVVLAEIGKMENHAAGNLESVLKAHKLSSPVSDVVQHQLALYREGEARAKDIYDNPNKSDRGPVPGMHTDGTGTTAAGRAPIPHA
jgi:uncharacterized protein (TIGR02284 family)